VENGQRLGRRHIVWQVVPLLKNDRLKIDDWGFPRPHLQGTLQRSLDPRFRGDRATGTEKGEGKGRTVWDMLHETAC